jgi:hypothetical protein
VALSLKFPKDPQGIYFWTYVKEYRYFAPAIFLIIVYLFKTYGAFEKGMRRHILTYMLFFAIVWATGLKLYYTYIGNKAASFENMYGRIFTVADHVNKLADKDTYFVSYTGDVVFDTQVTSIVAIKDIKVAMSYYGYFPDSTFKTPFMAKQISAGKKIIVYLDHNRQMLDSVNAMNSHVVDTMADGGTFLVIKN